MIASANNHADLVAILIARGANIDQQLPSGETSLMIACLRGQVDAARALVLQ